MAIHRKDRFEFAATGDAMITRPLRPYEGVSDRFDGLVDVLRGADATATNLEVLVHDYDDDAHPTNNLGTYMRAPPAVLDDLAALGCTLYTAATNHSFDYGYGGMLRTLRELETRGLTHAGLGRNRYEARKPGFVETPAGRVALLSACTTINPGSEATPQTEALRGSPGINPLHRDRVYRLPPDQLEQLRAISETLNFETIKDEWRGRGVYGAHDWLEEAYFHFMDMKFEEVDDPDDAGIHDTLDEDDREAMLEWVREADRMADWVVMGVHSHESPLGFHNQPEPPGFMEAFARECVDAGADAFVGHGPHLLRGIEVYDGAPIFYSLGNFVDQRETIERLPPDQFHRHGADEYTRTSEVFDSRARDDDGALTGDFANPWWWRSAVPQCTFGDDGVERIELHPITLQRTAGRPARGTPVLATGDEADAIVDRLADLSEPFGTDIERDDGWVVK